MSVVGACKKNVWKVIGATTQLKPTATTNRLDRKFVTPTLLLKLQLITKP